MSRGIETKVPIEIRPNSSDKLPFLFPDQLLRRRQFSSLSGNLHAKLISPTILFGTEFIATIGMSVVIQDNIKDPVSKFPPFFVISPPILDVDQNKYQYLLNMIVHIRRMKPTPFHLIYH